MRSSLIYNDSTAKIISLNPGQKTPAALNPDLGYKIARRNILNLGKNDALKANLRSLFVVGSSCQTNVANRLMITRFVYSLLLGLTGLLNLLSGSPMWFASIWVVCGLVLALGFMTRPLMLGGFFAIFASTLYLFFNSQLLSLPLALLMILAGSAMVIFAITGAGAKSADAMIRLRVFKTIAKHRMRKELRKYEFSYKAYRNLV